MDKLGRYLDYRTRNFSPAWFAANMGVGITAAILYNFPFRARWLEILGIVVWAINLGLFGLFFTMFVLRFIKYPDQFWRMLYHPGQSAFLGCLPMGYTTLINMVHYIWGHKAWVPVYVLWWISVISSLLCVWGVVFVMFSSQKRTIETLNATILLPVVTVVVSGATGGLIASAQPAGLQPSTLIVSFLIWANGQAVGLSFIAIYMYRLLVSNLHPRMITFSVLLPIGPLGQGAFGIQCIGQVVEEVLKRDTNVNPAVIEAVKYGSVFIALFLVGYGTFWVVMSVSTALYLKPTQFHMSWWGLTFPLGTYVVAWYKLAEILQITTFKVIGAVFGVIVALNVVYCSIASIHYAVIRSDLFGHTEAETWPAEKFEQSSQQSSQESKV